MRAAARWAAMHSGDSLVGPAGGVARVLPAAGWGGVSGGGGVRGRRVRRRAGSVHRVRAPLPVPRGGGVLPAPALLGPARGRGAAGVAAGVHRRAHRVPLTRGGGVRGHPCRAGGAQDRAGPAGPVDRRGQGPVRPRARPRPTGSPRPRPGTSTSGSATPGSRAGSQVDGDLDLADALDLEAAVAADAHHQLLLGSTESLDVRRAIAIGNLARAQQPLDLTADSR